LADEERRRAQELADRDDARAYAASQEAAEQARYNTNVGTSLWGGGTADAASGETAAGANYSYTVPSSVGNTALLSGQYGQGLVGSNMQPTIDFTSQQFPVYNPRYRNA